MALTPDEKALLAELIAETYEVTDSAVSAMNSAKETSVRQLITAYSTIRLKSHFKLKGGKDGVFVDYDPAMLELSHKARVALGMSARSQAEIEADANSAELVELDMGANFG